VQLKRGVGAPETGPVRRTCSNRGTWLAGLVLVAALLGGRQALARHLRAAPRADPRAAGCQTEGASAELMRARREQALIRAEGTATMLRALQAAPTLPEAGP
jgi:hypothetical protein